MNDKLKKLSEVKDKITDEMEDKWSENFNNQARYMGNGIYSIANLYAKDTRYLFLMFIAQQEFNIQFE